MTDGSQFDAWGGGYEPPIVGGKHSFKLKDLKASVNAAVKRMGIENHSWRGERREGKEKCNQQQTGSKEE